MPRNPACIPVLSRQEETVKKPTLGFPFSRLARRLAETGLSAKPPPAPYAATLLPSREPVRLRKETSAPACLLARPNTSTRAGEGEAGEESSNVSLLPCSLARRASGASAPTSAAYGRPPHRSRGGHQPHSPYPSSSGLSGGFCRTQTAHPHHRQPWGWLRGTAPPRTGGTGAECSFPLTTPTGWEGARRKIRRGSPLPPTENQNPLERGSCLLSHRFWPLPGSYGLAALLSAHKNLPRTEASSSSLARTGGAASPARNLPSALPPAAF